MLHPTLVKMNIPERKSENFSEVESKIYKNTNNSLKSQESTERSSFQEWYETQQKTAKTGSVKGNKLPHETVQVKAKKLGSTEKPASQDIELLNRERNDSKNSQAILSGFHQRSDLILPLSVAKSNSILADSVTLESDKSETDDPLMNLNEGNNSDTQYSELLVNDVKGIANSSLGRENDSPSQSSELLVGDANDIANSKLLREDILQTHTAINTDKEYVILPEESDNSGFEKTGLSETDVKIENSELNDHGVKGSVSGTTGDEFVGLNKDKESVDEHSSLLSAISEKELSGKTAPDELTFKESKTEELNTAESGQAEESDSLSEQSKNDQSAQDNTQEPMSTEVRVGDESGNITTRGVGSIQAPGVEKNEPKLESSKINPEASPETARTRQAGLEQQLQSNKISISSIEQNAIQDSTEMKQDFKQQVQQRVDVSRTIVEIPVRQPVGHADWAKSIGDKMMMMVSRNMKVANIRLDPPNLGLMEVKITIGQDQQTQVNFVSQHAQVRDVLEAEIPRLRQMMEEQGINLLDVNVSDQPQNGTSEFSDRQNEGQDLANGEDTEQSVDLMDEVGLGLVDHYV